MMMAALLQVCTAGGPTDVLLRLLRPEWQESAYLVQDVSGRVQAFETVDQAVAEVEQRLGARQEAWIGLLQVNASAFAPAGFTLREGLTPCVNLIVGSQLLSGINATSLPVLSRYFSANPVAGQGLARRVVDAANARNPLPSFPVVPNSSGEYREAFVLWSNAQAVSAGRRAHVSLLP